MGSKEMATSASAAAPEKVGEDVGGRGGGGTDLGGPLPPLLHAPAQIPPASGVDASARQPVTAASFTYTSYYCEENVYLLCKQLGLYGVADSEGLDLFVVFISNEKKQIPLWHQKASKMVGGLVIWDYHVICVQSRRNEKGNVHHLVWDLDSSLPFPLPLNEYVRESFQPLLSSYSLPNRYFRVVHAPIFLRCFASDRTHMKGSSGNWISPPPSYNPIVAEDGTVNNIDIYIQIHAVDEMTDTSQLVGSLFTGKFGVVVGEVQLVELFSLIHRP